MATDDSLGNQSIGPAPAGWVVFSSVQPDQSSLRCANYSNREWVVTVNGEQVGIVSRGTQGRGGPRIVPFRGGSLVGRDAGEFGGGLWWSSSDGRIKAKISEDNVLGFVETSFGTLALTGLDHMGLRSGKVLVMSAEGPLPPTAVVLADLGEAPYAFSRDAKENVIVVTGSRLLRIAPPGSVETLFTTDYNLLYPNSVGIAQSGIIYVGMRHFVTRVTPVGPGHREDWLVPADCPKFEQKGLECVCVHGAKYPIKP